MGEECLSAFLAWKEEMACHNEFEGTVPIARSKSQRPATLGSLLVSWTFAGEKRCQLTILSRFDSDVSLGREGK